MDKNLPQAKEYAKTMAARAVHEIIARYLEYASDDAQAKSLADRMRKCSPAKKSGVCTITPPNSDYLICLLVAPVTQTHSMDIFIPPESVSGAEVYKKMQTEITHQIALIRHSIIAYYVLMKKEKKSLWKDITQFLGYELDLEPRKDNWATLFFAVADSPEKLIAIEDKPICIGVECYYRDIKTGKCYSKNDIT